MSRRGRPLGPMRTVIAAALVATWAAWAAAPLQAATAPEKAEKVAERMLKSKKAIEAATAQIDATLRSMNSMASAKSSEIVALYGDFSHNVDDLESMAKKAKSAAEKARDQREAYLKKWASSQDKIQNEQLKAASKARRDELMPKIDALKQAFTSVQETFAPFMQGLKDLKIFLGNDLSEQGIVTASSLMSQCNADGEKLQSDVSTAMATYEQLAMSLTPGGRPK